MVSLISPLKSLVSFKIATFIWNSSDKTEGLYGNEIQNDMEGNWKIQLTKHRDLTLHRVKTFITKNNLPFCLKDTLKDSIFILHEEYRQLFLWKVTYDPRNEIDLFEEGEFYAPKYFTASGKFNDVLWTKSLIQNENCPKNRRFKLALAYFFENECCDLCTELRNFKEGCSESEAEFVLKAILWITSGILSKAALKLKNVMNPDEFRRIAEINYSPDFFYLAALMGYEHAVHEMWRNMPQSHKIDTMENDRFFEVISGGRDFPSSNVSYFLYSQLPKDRKETFLHWCVQRDESEIWLTLLLSSSTEEYSEILELMEELPVAMYSKIFQSLSYRIRQLRLPLDAELFDNLWNKATYEKQAKILKKGTFIIENLVKAKSFHIVSIVMKRLSISLKGRMLLSGSYGSCINILHFLCKEGEFDFLQTYLSFFITDTDLFTKISCVRRDAIIILNLFRESSEFKAWFKNNLTKAERTEVNRRMRSLLASSTLCHDLSKEERNSAESSQSSRIFLYEKYFSVK